MASIAISNSLICGICQKEFSSVSVKNRHLRKIHNEDIQMDKNNKILCCLCPADNRDKFSSYKNYEIHLKTNHDISVKENNFNFKNTEEFEAWRRQENREVDYAIVRGYNSTSGDRIVYYNCNRSDYRGYKSVCEKRKKKVGGSIHIQGVCPSRIIVKISTDGLHTVTFVETHVGHDDDLRTKRLSESQQSVLVEKLSAGIPKEKIMKDARDTLQDGKMERINVITRADLAYLVRKYNIGKIRQDDDMVATTIKIEDVNSDLIMHEPSRSNSPYQDEFNHFMQEILDNRNKTLNSDEETRKVAVEQFIGIINQRSGDDLQKFLSEVWKLNSKMGKDNEQICKKRKV